MPTLEFFAAYFTSPSVLAFEVVLVSTVLAGLTLWTLLPQSRRRPLVLVPLLGASLAWWIFFALSLLLCEVYDWMVPQVQPAAEMKAVFGASLVLALAAAPLLSGAVMAWERRDLRHRLRDARAATGTLASAFEALCARMGVRARLLVLSTPRLVCCCAEGRSPTVIVSEGLLELLSPPEVEAVLAHELAHLRSRDATARILVRAFRRLLPFDLLVRFVDHTFAREMEVRADAAAAALQGEGRTLAGALVKLRSAAVPSGSLGLSSRRSLRLRLSRLRAAGTVR